MKRIVVATLAVGLAAMWSVPSARALPPLPKYVQEHYRSSPEYAKFVEAFAGLKSKCDACHKPGADKKARGHGLNDFGKAVHDNFKHRDFTAADKAKSDPAEAAKAQRLIADALVAAEALTNADGQVYGELIKAGKLPGKNE